jgi:hypothetical protein
MLQGIDMKKMFCLLVLLSQAFIAISHSKPMESHTNYNVILVHGAGGRYLGLDCDNLNYDEAYEYLSVEDQNSGKEEREHYQSIIGGYNGRDTTKSSAKDMDMDEDGKVGLRHWLTEDIFGGDKSLIYLQRPFTYPANSPANNAKELGDRTWKGNKNCATRRSKIEEAQEVRAKGREKLKTYRTDSKYYYEDSLLPPSRNILIAHSMGGVASREYVQGTGYNNDVDKVITLDSPHEGTGSLEMLLDLRDNDIERLEQGASKTAVAFLTAGVLLATLSTDLSMATIAANSALAASFVLSAELYNYGMGLGLTKLLDKHYERKDSLTPYINPKHSDSDISGIGNLKNRPPTDSLPMMRLLYGKNSMTFSDPSNLNAINHILPKATTTAFYNAYSQASGNGGITVNSINSFTGFVAGMVFGATLGDHGTTLIPEKSGEAKSTKSLDNAYADVMRRSFNGHIHDGGDKIIIALTATVAVAAASIVGLNYAFVLPVPAIAAAKAAIVATLCIAAAADISAVLYIGVNDLMDSHEAPLKKEYQTSWKAEKNTYYNISSNEKKYEPYRMEEFLYEKPFVNLRVKSSYSKDWKDQKIDFLGLHVGDSSVMPDISDALSELSPLTFKSSGDWETLGAKKERWKRVKGLEDSIPIRHADRYPMPKISVKDFITKYSFIVDDLMPHRLRQIRMNFNFMKDIAWECEDEKSEVSEICSFYTRSSGDWVYEGKYPHPVNKDGTFDFIPKDYGLAPLSLQKDNQNTVTITTTNKIGLSNTQRFHYLFTATKDLIEPHWPVQGAKLTSINNFQIYANALDYPDFIVQYGKDHILQGNRDSTINVDMLPDRENSSYATYTSKFPVDNLAEGSWNWHYEIKIGNNNSSQIWIGTVPFTIDLTPPNISLEAKEDINPNTSTFMARFTNNSDSTKDESLRLVYMRLDKMENNTVEKSYKMPLLVHVIAPEFGVSWEGLETANLKDGKYRLNAIAFDGAVGSLEQYSLMNKVALGEKDVSDLFKNFSSLAVKPGYNASPAASVDFIIDKTAPEITSFTLHAKDSDRDKPQHSLNDSETLTLNKDRTLRMNYTITEPLRGRDSTQVSLSWEFLNKKDNSTVLLRLGDNINMKNNEQSFSWEETSQMQLPDGDYIIRMKATDAAGNERFAYANKKLHVDRTAPVITTITSTKRTYTEVPPAKGYSAVMHFEQNDEIAANRSKLKCYYRIPPNKNWIFFAEDTTTISKNDVEIITIPINSSYIGTTFGKRYVEGGCMDAAGNFASNVDVFFVGHMTPRIVYPDSSSFPDQPTVVIRGFAPPPIFATALEDGKSAYRLRWRADGDDEWHTEGIDVGASKLNDDTTWISKEIYVEESDLGFWDREDLPNAIYWLELSTRQCGTCSWVSDSVKIELNNIASEKTPVEIVINSPASATGGKEEELSVRIEGVPNKDFRVRFYAKDANGNSLFDKSSLKMKDSPLIGKPVVSGDGIWLWSEKGEYHLLWRGLPKGDSLILAYKSGSIDEVCKSATGQDLNGCTEMPWTGISKNLEEIYGIPAGLNKAMILSGSSGHLVFRNKDAFYAIFSIGEPPVHVYLGAQKSELEEVANLSGMISINPGIYGLNVLWDGLTDTQHYPAAGTANIYAEIFENAPDGVVLRASKEIFITQPHLKIVTAEADTLADFYVVSPNSAGSLELGSKPFSYGIQGRDAVVKAWIEDSNKNIIRNNLLGENGTNQSATNSKSVYKLLWDGLDDKGFVKAGAGVYKFVVSAKETNGEETDILSRPFKLTVAGMQLAKGLATDTNGSAIKIAEAVIDSNNPERQIYTPAADYLVKADLSGYTLPDSVRTVKIGYDVGGTQVARGYKPKRFSLGVKRQRDSLDLVIFYKLTTEENKAESGYPCKWDGKKTTSEYGVFLKSFTAEKSRSNVIEIKHHSDRGNHYGFDAKPAILEVWAVLPKKYSGDYSKKNAKELIENGEIYNLTPVWKVTEKDNAAIVIPYNGNAEPYSPKMDDSCDPGDSEDNDKICNDKTEGYDPHANLFSLTAFPTGGDGKFFTDEGNIAPSVKDPILGIEIGCNTKAYKEISFNLKLEIPDSTYWNAGFGYDNLVNRTIRLDHTNITMFGDRGYLNAVQGRADSLYYDGSNWKSDNINYGMLTPFEIQKFPFVGADVIDPSMNAFLFPDEDGTHKYPSRFQAKFYNTDTVQGRFHAYIRGRCDTGVICNRSFRQSTKPRVYATGLMNHGTTSIYVTLDANQEHFPSDTISISYPASSNWIDNINASDAKVCSDYKNKSWRDINDYTADCLKFYRAGSKVHYYLNDYNDSIWASKMLIADGSRFDNILNNPSFNMKANSPETMLGLKTELMGRKNSGETSKISLNHDNYNEQKKEFYLNSYDIGYPTTSPSGISASITPIIDRLDTSKYYWDNINSQLVFKAEKWKENVVYRYANHQKKGGKFPSAEESKVELNLMDLYTNQSDIKNSGLNLYNLSSGNSWEPNPWIKNPSIVENSPQITLLDSSAHTHFEASKQDSSIILLSRIPTDIKRPSELVAVHGRVPGSARYQISYVVNNKDDKKEFNTFKTDVMGKDRGTDSLPPFLKWLDVNRLQGNTSFFLSWGGDGNSNNLMYRKLDLYIGNMLNGNRGAVKSLFGEISVDFPAGSVPDSVGVTVRTADAKDYPFITSNNVSIRGPIVEVLPSMEFNDSLPRIKARISKEELGNISPNLVRLYKVDFKNEKFIPLDGTLIGFLKADGNPAVEYIGEDETKMCDPMTIGDCLGVGMEWAYLLISAETRTFSVFAALDSRSLVQNPVTFAVSPELSTNRVREIKVSGTENYLIYISDKPKWNAEHASQILAELESGANGEVLISLPERLDSWLYLVALNENGEETSDIPLSVHVQLIPSEISCEVSPASIWLGLDNGYLEFPQSCNQPAMGILQLRQGSNIIAEVSQSLPDTIRWDGKAGSGKIPHGSYFSRYIALGATGQEMQTIGPEIYTDTLRPAISNWSVEESSAVIDREFRIKAKATDDYSGLQSIRLIWDLGDVISGTLQLIADSGSVDYTLRLSRKQLAQCAGCKLKISLIAEDKGHNWSGQEWQSDRLWPYPAELALWYPAQEGGGKIAKEYTGTEHDLNLLMPEPWQSASGIYFEKSSDKAIGKDQVDLGRTNSYTFEAWVRPGYNESSGWSRILGFNFSDGKRANLHVNRNGDIRLLDGTETWTVQGLLSPQKAWSHLAVAVNGDWANFYIDGQLAGRIAAAPSERLWHGSFSLGMDASTPSFTGHLMQVRLYKKALTEEEVYALFSGVGLSEEALRTEIALAGELDWKTDGVGRGFSCAVPGSAYWETSKESSASWRVYAEQASSYRIFLYARSAQPGSKAVKAGVSGTLVSGTVSLENVWRPVALQEISLPLKAGFNDIELRFPAGMDIAGIAISSNQSILPSQISWKSENSVAPQATVATQVSFVGHPEPSMIRPRVRLQNIGSSTIYGPKVRYYFRGEDPAQVLALKFFPQEEGNLMVRQESDNLGYAEWSFPETTTLPAGQLLFWGEGPHFGLHNTNFVPWVIDDDATDVIVLDSENRILSGSCFENEHPLNTTPIVQVLARDSRAGDNMASQLYIKLENIGQVPIRNYEVRYSFYVPNNATPVFDAYDMQGLSAALKNLGSGRWQVIISGSTSLGPGISWANPAQFALHLPNWQTGWNTADDPSYEGLSAEWMLAKGIEVFDASGNRIYGKEPSWPTELANSSPSGTSSSSSSFSAPSAQVRVMAKEMKMHESNASSVRFYVENAGSESISSFEVRYWFSLEQGKALDYQIYSNTQFLPNVANDGGNLYSGRFAYIGSPLAPGAKTEWGEGLEFLVHNSDWSFWNKESDFSHKGLGAEFSEARYMAVYDSEGNLIWGMEPVIPAEISAPLEITRLPNGLMVPLLESTLLRLDLVNAAGTPQKFIYQGTLGAGEHIIPVDWSGVDFSRTYLVVRLNGKITAQLLSTLGN